VYVCVCLYVCVFEKEKQTCLISLKKCMSSPQGHLVLKSLDGFRVNKHIVPVFEVEYDPHGKTDTAVFRFKHVKKM
jgi:hypothetical protein